MCGPLVERALQIQPIDQHQLLDSIISLVLVHLVLIERAQGMPRLLVLNPFELRRPVDNLRTFFQNSHADSYCMSERVELPQEQEVFQGLLVSIVNVNNCTSDDVILLRLNQLVEGQAQAWDSSRDDWNCHLVTSLELFLLISRLLDSVLMLLDVVDCLSSLPEQEVDVRLWPQHHGEKLQGLVLITCL
jgi:hypothetical protein